MLAQPEGTEAAEASEGPDEAEMGGSAPQKAGRGKR
jgi:hypothetical protein